MRHLEDVSSCLVIIVIYQLVRNIFKIEKSSDINISLWLQDLLSVLWEPLPTIKIPKPRLEI